MGKCGLHMIDKVPRQKRLANKIKGYGGTSWDSGSIARRRGVKREERP